MQRMATKGGTDRRHQPQRPGGPVLRVRLAAMEIELAACNAVGGRQIFSKAMAVRYLVCSAGACARTSKTRGPIICATLRRMTPDAD